MSDDKAVVLRLVVEINTELRDRLVRPFSAGAGFEIDSNPLILGGVVHNGAGFGSIEEIFGCRFPVELQVVIRGVSVLRVNAHVDTGCRGCCGITASWPREIRI